MHQSYLPYVPGSFGVTMEHASFGERFYNTIIAPLKSESGLQDAYKFQHKILKEAGVEPYNGMTYRFDKGLVFAASLPGIDVSCIKCIFDHG